MSSSDSAASLGPLHERTEPVTELLVGIEHLLILDTCSLRDLVRTQPRDGQLSALDQREAAAELLQRRSRGRLAFAAPDRVLLELERARTDAENEARDALVRFDDAQQNVLGTLQAIGCSDGPATIDVDRYVEHVTATLDTWAHYLHRLPETPAGAQATLERIDAAQTASRTVSRPESDRGDPRKTQLWDTLILETVFASLAALDAQGLCPGTRLFLSGDRQAFGSARRPGTALHQAFATYRLRYVDTFREAQASYP